MPLSENQLTSNSVTYLSQPRLATFFPTVIPFFPSSLISRHLPSLGSEYENEMKKSQPYRLLAFLPTIFLILLPSLGSEF